MLIFGALAAMGAGLHVAAYYIEHHRSRALHFDWATATVLTVAIPVTIYIAMLYLLYSCWSASVDPFHIGSAHRHRRPSWCCRSCWRHAGVSMAWCLLVVALAPVVSIVGYETVGHRHQADALAADS